MAHDQEQQEPVPQHFPLISTSYRLLDEIGNGVSAVVYKAECTPLNSTLVAIKSIDLDQSSKADFDSVRRESKTMCLLSHPNILKAHCSFLVDRRLWVVMPFMSSGSLQSIVSSSFQDGLTEPCIAIVLKETLKALCYLHDQGHLHRDIKAGNILVDSNGSVKLADFGVSASIYESNLSRGSHSASSSSSTSSSMMLTDVAGTPYWMAPEVIHSHNGYSYKADIWSFGITALELAHGRPPLSHLPPSKSLLMKLTKRFRFSDYDKSENKDKNKKKFSKSFKEMVKSCLDQDPSKRPTAEKLLRHSFFKNCRSSEFLVRNVLLGLPSVEQRFKDAKLRRLGSINRSSEEEEDDDDQEGGCSSMGVRTKNRRISGWNLNEDGFELDPVFPSEIFDDTVVKQVRFGGESIIKDRAMEVGAESDHVLEETIPSLPRVVEGEVVEEEAHEQAQDQAQTQGQAQDQAQIQDQAHELAQEDDEVNGDPTGQGEAEGGSGSSVGSCIVNIADGLENEEAQTIAQAQAHEGDHGSEAGGEGRSNVNVVVANNESMLGGLLTLKRSLDEQRQNVMLMINVIGGEEALAAERNREEQMRVLIERLSLQLEQEKHKNFELEMELEYYKLYISGGASGN